ncbi:hypothetical protein [Cecembia calidifontis]|jgi:hypothetical protein|uniref:Uncharacterized protein n=1 Tax=Cecembia calidifontis TaxID=1187080 RepID=A0A4Q7PB52_9BACT|nr:hypothetical protein [Cecembia calidifontis]RZS97207.1 hypothetical protein BC751_2805 [Cecembia calidifontis]
MALSSYPGPRTAFFGYTMGFQILVIGTHISFGIAIGAGLLVLILIE